MKQMPRGMPHKTEGEKQQMTQEKEREAEHAHLSKWHPEKED